MTASHRSCAGSLAHLEFIAELSGYPLLPEHVRGSEPEHLGDVRAADLPIQADVKVFMRKLLAHLEQIRPPIDLEARRKQVNRIKERCRLRREELDQNLDEWFGVQLFVTVFTPPRPALLDYRQSTQSKIDRNHSIVGRFDCFTRHFFGIALVYRLVA